MTDLFALHTDRIGYVGGTVTYRGTSSCPARAGGEAFSRGEVLAVSIVPLLNPPSYPVCRLSITIEEMTSNWIKEVPQPRGFPESLPPQLTAPPKPHTRCPQGVWCSLLSSVKTHTGDSWPQFLAWLLEATISITSVDCWLNLNRWPQKGTGLG
mgnify:CR=1 FL=1